MRQKVGTSGNKKIEERRKRVYGLKEFFWNKNTNPKGSTLELSEDRHHQFEFFFFQCLNYFMPPGNGHKFQEKVVD